MRVFGEKEPPTPKKCDHVLSSFNRRGDEGTSATRETDVARLVDIQDMSLVIPCIWVLGKFAGEHGTILLYAVEDQWPMLCGHAFHCRTTRATIAPYYQRSICNCIAVCLCKP